MKLVNKLALSALVATGLWGASGTNALAEEPAPVDETQRFEIDIMNSFIDHHTMGIEMAELCIERAARAELIELCTESRDEQREERETKQGWLQQWYGEQVEPQLTPVERHELEDLSHLTGEEFEQVFMQRFSVHHAGALRMANECLVRGYHAPLLDMCEEIASMQAEEIRNLRGWLRAWYGIGDINRRAGGWISMQERMMF